jgi:hypothetical protein
LRRREAERTRRKRGEAGAGSGDFRGGSNLRLPWGGETGNDERGQRRAGVSVQVHFRLKQARRAPWARPAPFFFFIK